MRTLFTLVALSLPASPADLYVSPGDSLQTAIDAAAAGDRILVAPGTYFEHLDFQGKEVQVIGVAGAASTVLDGQSSGVVVRFSKGEGPGTRLAGFTITGGYANAGAGGIACSFGSTPTVEDCIVTSNRGKFGGGISGSPFVRRTAIVQNTASLTHGGGVYGAPQLDQCLIAGNTATSADGGGVYLVGGAGVVSMTDCVVVENRAILAGSTGGGIYIDSSVDATIERTLVVGNFSTGGVFLGRGGGVLAESAGSTLASCTVIGNSVSGGSTQGAGTWGPLELVNSIVRDNLGADQITGAQSVTYCNVSGGFGGLGNFDADPGFVDALQADLHLLESSPCIGAGDPSLLDPDGSRSDVGAFAYESLYARSNLDPALWLDPVWSSISLAVGGAQGLVILAGAENAGNPFLALGSASGTTPPFPLFGLQLPLAVDAYFLFTLGAVNHPPLSGSFGNLDDAGRAEFSFTALPMLDSSLAGLELNHAVAVGDATSLLPVFVTNAKAAQLVP